MLKIKTVKILFLVAALIFVAKPFLGFSMFSRLHPPAEDNIFVKVFSKRKLEFEDDGKHSIQSIQKDLALPLVESFLLFTCLLSILFPVVFASGSNITHRFLRNIRLDISRQNDTYLLHGAFLI